MLERIMTVLETCPHCEDLTDQRHIYTQPNQSYVETVDGRKLVLRSAYFVMVCESCKGIILYQTPELESDAPEAKTDDWDDEEEGYEEAILRLAFIDKNSECVPRVAWPTKVAIRVHEDLAPCVPPLVRDFYREAISVKHSPKSFAVQIGNALEVIQKDLGIPKKGLEQLESRSPLGLSQIAIRIKDWRNLGAHPDPGLLTAEDVGDIDDFIRLIIDHVYVFPDKLKRALQKLEMVGGDVDSNDEAIH
jgi:hypothetical protein